MEIPLSKFLVQFFLTVLVAVASVHSKECFDVIEDHRLDTEPISHSRVSSLEECQDLCMSRSDCSDLVYGTNGKCLLFDSKSSEHELVFSEGDLYSFKETDCIDELINSELGLLTRIKRRIVRGWDSWSAWGACSATCGLGVQMRQRSCPSGSCSGDSDSKRKCSQGPCMQWQPWNAWQACSKTCGQGQRARTRFCPNYYGCGPLSDNAQRENCIVKPCGGSNWLPWGGWSACSAMCGGGQRSRRRQCSGGGGCQGDSVEDQPCNPQSCCSPWTKYGKCSVTCGGASDGIETRTRYCTVEDKTVPTGYASKRESENRPCADLPQCGEWESWSEWGACSAPCGAGEMRRERTCSIPGACAGNEEGFKRCNNGPCSAWQPWSAWGRCDATCGGGLKQRERVCTQEGRCSGDAVATQACANYPCPEWIAWGAWSYCSSRCGGGWQKRSRVCNMYNLCAGDNKEKRLCNNHVCPKFGSWEPWGECTEPCGGNGYQLRERSCIVAEDFCNSPENGDKPSCFCDDEGESQDAQPCNAHECATWTVWQPWGSCSVPCGGGERKRERRCGNDPDFCLGPNKDHPSCSCGEGETELTETCNDHVCPQWSTWQDWGTCSEECGVGMKRRNRTCTRDEDYCAGRDPKDVACVCSGLDHSNDQCNTHPCPRWSPWNRWGSCNATCAGGVRTRSRTCQADQDICVGDKVGTKGCMCQGESTDNNDCNSHECATWIKWSHWGECSKSCEGGVQTRKRNCKKDFSYCFGAKLFTDPSCKCEGEPDGEQVCNEHACSGWTEWAPWEECSASCGGGTRDRIRDCTVDEDYCDGAKMGRDPACMCPGTDTQSSQCNQVSCPSWANWESWGSCSVSCSQGVVTRNRECNLDVRHCKGSNMDTPQCKCGSDTAETQECDAGACASWTAWADWTDCTAVCGGGSRNRSRDCPEVGGCPGLKDETEFCNQVKCPDWGDWSPWSDCSATCGGGRRAKTRSCALPGGCKPGEPLTLEPCNDQKCPIWSQWGEWSSCSRSCGEGKRERTRDCTPIDGCLGGGRQSEPCSVKNCELQTHWSEWSPCSTTCGGGLKTRARVPCVTCAVEEETAACEEQNCPTWGTWLPWDECSATCGGGFRLRSRQCELNDGSEVPRGCIGRAQEIDADPCNDFAC